MFSGIEIARRALMAHQKALDTTSHNVANANTPGYSRQEVVLSSTEPITALSASKSGGLGQLGTGVEAIDLKRYHDKFLDRQFRNENTALGNWETRERVLREVEAIMAEPSDAGLRTALDKFWQTLQDLANDPESSSARALVRERGVALASQLNNTARFLGELRANVDGDIVRKAGEVNLLADRIVSFNRQISAALAAGDKPNDLMDQRDSLLDRLSKIVDITVSEGADGKTDVLIEGVPLVTQLTVDHLTTQTVGGQTVLGWEKISAGVTVSGGELRGLLDMRDAEINGLVSELDTLASTFAAAFNAVHAAGYGLDSSTGTDFFVSATGPAIKASTIAVNPTVVSDLNKIAAAKTLDGMGNVYRGDGANALDLARVKENLIFNGGTANTADYYESIISGLAVSTQAAKNMTGNQEVLTTAIDNQKTAVSGVSLDDEMINMVKFQQGYNAAARVITAMDELMDTIINRLGVVGR